MSENYIDPQYYNTQREHLDFSEYGRNVQNMVRLIQEEPDRDKRNIMAIGVVNIMATLNPHLREVNDHKQKLWDHLFAIADYNLDVDSPYPKPEPNVLSKKPERLPYQDNLIRFRFYGRNLQNMVLHAAEMEEGETKTAFINLIASFMRNSCKNWNNENLNEGTISEHLRMLSGGKLELSAEDITILFHTKEYNRNNNNRRNNSNNNNRRNKGGRRNNQRRRN